MTALISSSAVELRRLIELRRVSPVEVAEALLAQIEQLNSSLNAIVTLSPTLLDDARQAEQEIMRGGPLGPLHGLPITIKDTIDTAGVRTTSGSLMRAARIASEDAPAVAHLKAAGAILLGKTNTAEMAMDYTADNPVFGRTLNPFDLARTPGGSSGGEAAAISTCMSVMGLGSDLAGSIRIPAHFCGIVGFKPGSRRVASGGQFPPGAGPYSLGSVIGPMARCVADARLLFKSLTDQTGTSNPSHQLHRTRVAWYVEDGITTVTRETSAAVESAAKALMSAGFIVAQQRPPAVERALDVWLSLFSRASVVLLRDVYGGNEDKAGPFVRWRLATADDAPAPSLDDYIRSWLERDRLREQLLRWMETTPLLLTPVGAVPAFEHDAHKVMVDGKSISGFRAFSYAQAFNAFDLPAVTVPAGRSEQGMPIGVQVVGRPGEEEIILAAAELIEDALGGWQPPPLCNSSLGGSFKLN